VTGKNSGLRAEKTIAKSKHEVWWGCSSTTAAPPPLLKQLHQQFDDLKDHNHRPEDQTGELTYRSQLPADLIRVLTVTFDTVTIHNTLLIGDKKVLMVNIGSIMVRKLCHLDNYRLTWWV
jgi:hypothetical protein